MSYIKEFISTYGIFGILGIVFLYGVLKGIIGILVSDPEGKRVKKSKREKGSYYETTVNMPLKRYLGVEPLTNLLMKTKYTQDGWTEIDSVFVTTKGVFCIECKRRHNNGQKLYCDMDLREWLPDLKNPISQNAGHVKTLKDYLQIDNGVYNIVAINLPFVFSYMGVDRDSDKIKNIVNLLSSENFALIRQDMEDSLANGAKSLANQIKEMPDIFTQEQVDNIKNRLKDYVATKDQLNAHAEYKEAYYK